MWTDLATAPVYEFLQLCLQVGRAGVAIEPGYGEEGGAVEEKLPPNELPQRAPPPADYSVIGCRPQLTKYPS